MPKRDKKEEKDRISVCMFVCVVSVSCVYVHMCAWMCVHVCVDVCACVCVCVCVYLCGACEKEKDNQTARTSMRMRDAIRAMSSLPVRFGG